MSKSRLLSLGRNDALIETAGCTEDTDGEDGEIEAPVEGLLWDRREDGETEHVGGRCSVHLYLLEERREESEEETRGGERMGKIVLVGSLGDFI